MNIAPTLGAFAFTAFGAAAVACLSLVAAGATIGFAFSIIGAPGVA
jgi:hypothetical protein